MTYIISSTKSQYADTVDARIETSARPSSKAFAQAVRDFEDANGIEAGTFKWYSDGVDSYKHIKRSFASGRI